MDKVKKVNNKQKARTAYFLAAERTCKRTGKNYEQTLSLLNTFFEEAQCSFRENGIIELPNFLKIEMQQRGGHEDKFYTLDNKGEKVYRLGDDGKRLRIKKVRFPAIKAHIDFRNFVRGNAPISEESAKYQKLIKVSQLANSIKEDEEFAKNRTLNNQKNDSAKRIRAKKKSRANPIIDRELV
jgi:hypothetical protein